jgi:hypothetical protein
MEKNKIYSCSNLGMVVGDCYYNQDVTHCKNENFLRMEFRVCHDLSTIQDSLGDLKEFIQFVITLHIFIHGRPIS